MLGAANLVQSSWLGPYGGLCYLVKRVCLNCLPHICLYMQISVALKLGWRQFSLQWAAVHAEAQTDQSAVGKWLRGAQPSLGPLYLHARTHSHTGFREHCGRGSEEVLESAVLWTWHGRCAHNLPVAMVTCTRPSQKDQLTFQQAALIGLRGHEGEGGARKRESGGYDQDIQN